MELGKTIGYGVLIWVIGFVWGTVVFMVPAMKAVASIPMFSRYPLISFPLLILFPLLAYWLAPRCVERARPREAVPPVGFVFVAINVLLDYLVLVVAFKAGMEYFYFLSVWLTYAAMVVTSTIALKRLIAKRV